MWILVIAAALALSGCVSAGYMNRRVMEAEKPGIACQEKLEQEMRFNDNIIQHVEDKYGEKIQVPK